MASGSKSQMTKKVSSSKTKETVTQKKPSASALVKPKKPFELPAFSVPYVPKVTESELDKLKKKTIRRNAPPGEDLQAIKTILRNIKDQDVSVQEFISLVAPSTGDKGEALRQVMNEDLVAFRKLARKVYDMITKDNSDVLLNQQVQLAEYYKEKKNLLNAKMMSMIEDIYMMVPNFDFDRYANEGQRYLEEVLPIPEELKIEPEEYEMMKRQAAYHRLQWLRSEGERLNEENNSLKKRLNQLKKQHLQGQRNMEEKEKEAEAKRQALEKMEAEKEETLEMLNKSLEKTIITQEKSLRESQDEAVSKEPTKATGAVRKQTTKVKRMRKPKWNEEAAREIESRVLNESKRSEISRRDPFHFSPIKTPPRQPPAAKETSPFHYSPPKTPEEASYASPPLPPQRVQGPAVEQAASSKGRRAQAPRDTWGGFY